MTPATLMIEPARRAFASDTMTDRSTPPLRASASSRSSRAMALLEELVATPSVSGDEAAAAAAFVRHATDMGLTARVDAAGNATAERSSDGGSDEHLLHIALLGHIDTVPGEIPVRIENGELWGRGSVDAKGSLCTMLCAAARADLPAGVRLSVIGAVEEEAATSRGARFVGEQIQPDICIIGEPSGWNGVTLGYKGRLLVEFTLRRPCAHAAGPDGSAADHAIDWWNDARTALRQASPDGAAGAFDVVQSTIRSMHTATDGLHDEVTLLVGLRLPLWCPPQRARQLLASIGRENARLRFLGAESGHRSDRSNPAARALSTAIRSHGGRPHPKVKTGTSDMNVVAPMWNCPIVAYGPGDASLDHTPEERLDLDEYDRAIAVLADAITLMANEALQTRNNTN